MLVNFGKMMLNTALAYRNKEALVNVEKNRRFTFMELHLITNKICNAMTDTYLMKKGDVFVTLLKNDDSSLFSVWMAKGKATSFWMDYLDSYDNHLEQLDQAKPRLAFLDRSILERYYQAMQARKVQIVCLGADQGEELYPGVISFEDFLEDASEAETDVEYDDGRHIVAMRYTGGTTGKNKCVPYTLQTFFSGMHFLYTHPENYLSEETRHLHLTPLTHGALFAVLPVYFKGGTHLTINGADLPLMGRTIQDELVTQTMVVPTLLYRLVDLGIEQEYDLGSLKTVFYGAAPMSPSKLVVLQERFGNIFVQAYGASEAFPALTILSKKEHCFLEGESMQRINSAGRVLPGVEIRIVDDDGNEMETGETGELWIRSRSVVKGYVDNLFETQKAFTSKGFWKSGDLGYLDEDGYLYLVDRKKDMIISGGFNVYAAEVEAVLNSHPCVQQSVVIGIPHPDWGEAVHAEVIRNSETEPVGEKELIAFCKEHLGKYKNPKSIAFVEELPLSGVGKVLRRMVRDKYLKKS
ncbi:MAG: AMP-binding protein [Coriobacteriia bacterium]|nr:AMP-binding protein [Coriobacteriia bacterium]MCL2749635.1 AMP-binding protein [Coriobacteriia bacterium]